jgi:hypothetical protein
LQSRASRAAPGSWSALARASLAVPCAVMDGKVSNLAPRSNAFAWS